METIQLTTPTSSKQATIIVGNGSIASLATHAELSKYSKILVVGDRNISKSWLAAVRKQLPTDHAHLILPPGERAKHIRSIQKIWKALLEAKCDRKSLLVAVGGGVIGDMAGFAAATYMRGIDYLHVPTSLLAQVDSSVGGKTAIDFDGVKNLVGSFAQPVCTIIDVQTLQTLPGREFVSGFGELIKHGFIRDTDFLKLVTSKNPADFSPDELVAIIAWSCKIKAEVVMQDEHESGLRKALNFGHTVGHAVESLSLESSQPLLHGEAVSIGMVVEGEISHQQGLLTAVERDQIIKLLARAGLPTRVPASHKTPDLIAKMQADKKNVGNSIRFSLLQGLGNAVWDRPIDETTIIAALAAHRGES